MLHVLRECPVACQVWDSAPILRVPQFQHDSVQAFLQAAKNAVNLPMAGVSLAHLYPWICWNLWTARNALVFDDRSFSPVEILTKAIIDAKLWQAAQLELPRPRAPTQRSTPPQMETGLSCYVDAAWNQLSRRCGMGWICKDQDTGLEFSGSSTRTHVSSALAAEAWAIREALLNLQAQGFDEVHLHSDSLTMVNLISSNDFHIEVQSILSDIKEIRNSLSAFSISFIPRLNNSTADSIAKQALLVFLPASSGSLS